VLDDPTLIPNNPLIQSLAGIPTLFRSDYWAPEIESGLYRPFVTISHALTYAVAGDAPGPYHGLNIALHALNCALIVALFRRLTAERMAIAAGACFFAAHAVHSEVVANVAGRAELLCALFFLLALLAYVAAGRGSSRRSWLFYAGSLVAYAAALLSKESAITLLGVIVLYDFVYDGAERESRPLPRLWRLVRGRFVPRYAGYVALACVYLAVRYLWLGIGGPAAGTVELDNPLLYLDEPWRTLSALKVVFLYVWLLILPLRLSYDYSYNAIALLSSFRDPAVFLVLGLSALGLWFVVWSYRWSKDFFYAVGFALVSFSVVSNLVIGIGTILAERLLYVPSIGFCLAASLGAQRALAWSLSPRTARAIFVGVFAAVVALNGGRAFVRNRDWASDPALMIHDLGVKPESAKVRANAGAMMLLEERLEEAKEQFEKAIAIAPTYHQPRINLGDHPRRPWNRHRAGPAPGRAGGGAGARECLLPRQPGMGLLQDGPAARGPGAGAAVAGDRRRGGSGGEAGASRGDRAGPVSGGSVGGRGGSLGARGVGIARA
jgi:uncharacterized membrane protein YgcG